MGLVVLRRQHRAGGRSCHPGGVPVSGVPDTQETRPGVAQILWAGVKRSRREHKSLYWIAVADLESLLADRDRLADALREIVAYADHSSLRSKTMAVMIENVARRALAGGAGGAERHDAGR